MSSLATLRIPGPTATWARTRDRGIGVAFLVLGLGDLAVLDLWAFPRALAGLPPRQAPNLRPPRKVPLETAPPVPARVDHVGTGPERVLYFRTGDDQLEPSERVVVDQAAQQLLPALVGDAAVVVHGYADPRGAVAFNQTLSLRRARAVARRLAQQGIAPQRIRVEAFGETRSQVVDGDRESLRVDRRVEIYVRRGFP